MRRRVVFFTIILLFLCRLYSTSSAIDDTTGPELISFRILENGQTLTVGDIMHVEVNFSDESGIRIIQGFTSGPEGTYTEFKYNQEKDIWEWSYTISQYDLNGEFKIRSIWAYDNCDNSSGIFSPDDYVLLTGCTDDTTGPELISFRIVENGQTLTEGDTMHVEVKFSDVSGIRIIQGFTSGPEGQYAEFLYNATKDLWEWSYTITKFILNGKFGIKTIWAYDNVGNSSGSFSPEDYVTISGCTDNDTTGPELINFRIIENGQTLTVGDTIHVEVKFADASGIRIIQGFTSGGEGKYAEFIYNEAKDLWEWSYTFNEYTQNGEFKIRTIWAYDNVGNSSGSYSPDDFVIFVDPIELINDSENHNMLVPDSILDGWAQKDGKWHYYQQGIPVTNNWISDGVWYYFDAWGAMVTGWQQIASTWYYFNTSGAMTTGWINEGGTWYYFNTSGAMTTEWQFIDGAWYYFKPSGAMATGWQYINDTWYYFKPSGAMITGWQSDGGTWYYFKSSGAMATSWQYIDSTWYYFKPSGAMITGWYEDKTSNDSSVWYWFDNNGAMATGWKQINGQWEMFADSGAWLYTWDGN